MQSSIFFEKGIGWFAILFVAAIFTIAVWAQSANYRLDFATTFAKVLLGQPRLLG